MTRVCIDKNYCGTVSGKPSESQTCGLPAITFVQTTWDKTKKFASDSLIFIKSNPTYLIEALAGIMTIALLIRFRAPAIKYIKSFKISIERVNKR